MTCARGASVSTLVNDEAADEYPRESDWRGNEQGRGSEAMMDRTISGVQVDLVVSSTPRNPQADALVSRLGVERINLCDSWHLSHNRSLTFLIV